MYICNLPALLSLGDGRVFMWGRCDYGQLGLPGWCQSDKHRCCWQPTELPQFQNAKQVGIR